MNSLDDTTRILNRALDVVFAKYPARTGLGVVLGCALLFLSRLFDPALRTITFANFAGAPWWGWIIVGVLVMHSPTIKQIFRQKPVGDDAIDKALDLIERGNFTKAERRQQYRNLIEKVSANVALTQQAKRKVQEIERNISSTKPRTERD